MYKIYKYLYCTVQYYVLALVEKNCESSLDALPSCIVLVLKGVDGLYDAVDEKVLHRPKGDPKSFTTGVKALATVRKEAGRVVAARSSVEARSGRARDDS